MLIVFFAVSCPTQVNFCPNKNNLFFLGCKDEKDLVATEARFFFSTNGPVPGDLVLSVTVIKHWPLFGRTRPWTTGDIEISGSNSWIGIPEALDTKVGRTERRVPIFGKSIGRSRDGSSA